MNRKPHIKPMTVEEIDSAQFDISSYQMANDLQLRIHDQELTNPIEIHREVLGIIRRAKAEVIAQMYNTLESQASQLG